ncbi:hypothetical protein LSCM1_02293 [Leishmania martiniquensis]|uniref:PH-like domain-containing protein n=1 Tax=Leishmania martiniquensis TaxID=1580590 RepID=A0A836H1L8_9TRYP|nr:hypothetical protein LSCM1_02293 [Leishmania martiniquensis]
MGYNIEGIADDLSFEFHAMSSRRDRLLRSTSRGGDSGLCHELVDSSRGAPPRPLSCGHVGEFRSNDSKKMLNESDRWYDMYVPRWGCPVALGEPRPARVREMTAGSASREAQRQEASRSSGMGGPNVHGRSGGHAGRHDTTSWPISSSTYSYSSSYCSVDDASSGGGAEGPNRVHGGLRSPNRGREKAPKSSSRASARSQLRATPAGLPPLDAPLPGAIRWVVDGRRRGREAQGGGSGSQTGPLLRQRVDVYEHGTVATNPPVPSRPQMSVKVPSLQPIGFLRSIIAAVAHFRGVPPPPSVPPEVILAFDEYVSRGSLMLKFIPSGPPHSRFFVIRFLAVAAGSSHLDGEWAPNEGSSVPQAVLSWYHRASSRHMIRFLPLHDLVEVKAEGTDHRYVSRRMVQPGILRGPRSRFVTRYVRADFLLQFRFCSRLSQAQETLALMAANRAQYLAWLVVGSFISQISGIY